MEFLGTQMRMLSPMTLLVIQGQIYSISLSLRTILVGHNSVPYIIFLNIDVL